VKVTLRTGIILPVAAVLSLTACGSQNVNQDYLVTSNVKNVTCSSDNVVKLQATANFVNAAQPGSRQEGDILRRSSETSLEPLKTALSAKINECTNHVQPVVNANKNEVMTRDGNRVQLSVATGLVPTADTTHEADTPPVAPLPFLERCKGVLGWDELVKCVGDEQWYKDGVTKMKPYTGFDWNDVIKWADTKVDDPNTPEVDSKPINSRAIHVYGWTEQEKSQEQARTDVRALVNDEAALKDMPVVYHLEPSGTPLSFANSRDLEGDRVNPFVDRKKQVRVALSPIVFDEQGRATKLRGDAGIFVDCLNIWGMPFSIAPRPGTPVLCPPDSGMAGQPIPSEGPKGCTPPSTPPTTTTDTTPPHTTTTTPPVCPPGQHGTPPVCKDGPDKLPTHGNGTGTNIDPGPGKYIPPTQMEQPPATSRINPPPPSTNKPAPPATVKATVVPTQSTVQPSSQPTKSATLPGGPGCGNPELC
jgi:hypothetical protein